MRPKPIVILYRPLDMLFGIKEAGINKPIHKFPLMVGMKSVKVCVLLWRGETVTFQGGLHIRILIIRRGQEAKLLQPNPPQLSYKRL
jgi:hypothetical protein